MKLCCRLRFCLLFLLFAASTNAVAIDREAFSVTNYDLNVRVEPAQQRLAVRGKITLRNDSATPQKTFVLQISSSLVWRSIKVGGKPIEFVPQAYNSDIDHTGALSEATVSLTQPVPLKGTIDLEIAYEGIIPLDATRLTRIGAPESAAQSTDWDQISPKFTAVRGVGYVAWYPITTEDASLSEGKSLFEVLSRWKAREAASVMRLQIEVSSDQDELPEFLINATGCPASHQAKHQFDADCTYRSLGSTVPTFVIADYEVVTHDGISVHYLHGHDASAEAFADAADKTAPLIREWFGAPRNQAQAADLVDKDAAPFESGSLLLTPLSSVDIKTAGLVAAHQLTHAAFFSPRPWINEGVAHFAQALYLESRDGRQVAMDYMAKHRPASAALEKTNAATTEGAAANSLINSTDEELYRSKAMYVWWMLRDMAGDSALKKALAAYHSEQDKEPSYMPRLIQAQTQHDLEWFFDDWVYRDRGLPDFKVASAFIRKTLPNGYMVTVTVDNLGAAGAEVPLMVKFQGGEISKRLIVRGKSNGVIRVEVPQQPEEIVVNDGSVPESDVTNNSFKIQASDVSKQPEIK